MINELYQLSCTLEKQGLLERVQHHRDIHRPSKGKRLCFEIDDTGKLVDLVRDKHSNPDWRIIGTSYLFFKLFETSAKGRMDNLRHDPKRIAYGVGDYSNGE